jgi:hypothetical protein
MWIIDRDGMVGPNYFDGDFPKKKGTHSPGATDAEIKDAKTSGRRFRLTTQDDDALWYGYLTGPYTEAVRQEISDTLNVKDPYYGSPLYTFFEFQQGKRWEIPDAYEDAA